MKCGVPLIVVLIIHVGMFGVIPRHTGATASTPCILSQSPGNLSIDNHMKLTSVQPGDGHFLQPQTIVPFPNISFYSSCPFVQIDIIADGLDSLCSPNLAILKEFPGKKYQIASKLIPPSTHVVGIATWTGVTLDDYISDNSSGTEEYILGIAMTSNCKPTYKAASTGVTWVLTQGSSPRALQKFTFGAALEPPVTLTIRALDACHHAECDNCQTLYRSCPALGANGTSQHQYYCSSASNYTCSTLTIVQPTNRTTQPTTSPQQNTSLAVTATTVELATSYTLKYNSSSEVSTPESSTPVSQSTATSADVAISYVTGPSTSVILGICVPLIILALCMLLILLHRRKKRNSLAGRDQSRLQHRETENGLMLPRPSSGYVAQPQTSSGAAQNPSETLYYDIALEPVKASNSMRISRSSTIADSENQRPDDEDVPEDSLNSEHHNGPQYAHLETPGEASAEAQMHEYMLPSTHTQSRPNHYQSLDPHSNALHGGESSIENRAYDCVYTPRSSSLTDDNTRHQEPSSSSNGERNHESRSADLEKPDDAIADVPGPHCMALSCGPIYPDPKRPDDVIADVQPPQHASLSSGPIYPDPKGPEDTYDHVE
ncbi:uncharacterized protein LOC135811431 [Sycon ciliatum]|uniref:uncharacterized protein LOC135811431 n=1 Tax=Sycon ciliatum TaxID=27933 RepID=UPI0031F60397